MTYTANNIDDYQNRLTDEQTEKVVAHANAFGIDPNICAWYDDMDDFYSDWCDEIGYSKEEADALMCNNPDEFLTFEDGSIARFAK